MRKIAALAIAIFLTGISAATPEIRGPEPGYDRAVRRIEQEIRTLVGKGKGKRNSRIRIVFRADAPAEGKFSQVGSTAMLTLRADPYWCENPAALAAVAAMLLHDAAGTVGAPFALPDFLLAGLRGKLRHYSGAGRINRVNFRSPLLRALLAAGYPPANFPPVTADEVFFAALREEYAAAQLDFFARRRWLSAEDLVRTPPAEIEAQLAAKLAEAPEREAWRRMLESRAWHRFYPRDPELSAEIWREKFTAHADYPTEALRSFGRGESAENLRRVEAVSRATASHDDAARQAAEEALLTAWREQAEAARNREKFFAERIGVFVVAPHRLYLYPRHRQYSPLTPAERAFLDRAAELAR